MTVWKVLVQLALGPHKEVADMAKQIVNTLKLKVKESLYLIWDFRVKDRL